VSRPASRKPGWYGSVPAARVRRPGSSARYPAGSRSGGLAPSGLPDATGGPWSDLTVPAPVAMLEAPADDRRRWQRCVLDDGVGVSRPLQRAGLIGEGLAGVAGSRDANVRPGASSPWPMQSSQHHPAPLRIGQLLLEPGRRTYVMGILNVTPDSFAGDGVTDVEAAVARGRAMLAEGADLIDVGGESTRPGAGPVPLEEELRRVLPVVERLAGGLGAPVSVDTRKAEVARRALQAGAAMVNDVSALRADPAMAAVLAEARAPVVLMHWEPPAADGAPARDIVADVVAFLRERIAAAVAAGIARDRIVVDPGFGFAKTIAENLQLLRRLGELRVLGCPILVGTSRKGTIGKVLGGLPVEDRLEGTAATVALAIAQGADVVRVHDVRTMVRVARMADAIVREA
jgi:dihydropteroate synthase